MKYEKLLDNGEVEEILNLKLTLGERIKWFQSRFSIEEYKENAKVKFIFSLIQGEPISGNIINNPKGLICPNCNGKYVVRTFVGDFLYRRYSGTKKQRETEKNKLTKMGLHCNPWATGNIFTREYLCMNCGVRWNKKDEDIYRDF